MRGLRTGKVSFRQEVPDLAMFRPLAREVATMAKASTTPATPPKMRRDCAKRGNPCGPRIVSQCNFARASKAVTSFVVSNREPYMHQRNGKTIEVVVPPSGLVTALEPVLNACDGTWIAHGSGNAATLRLWMPPTGSAFHPDDPRYSLRRVWLTKEEEEGYYYGFANEGLWPLCHIAHTRPLFRASDWQYYQDVNRKFTAAVLEEIEERRKARGARPGLSLRPLPRMIKEKRPDARVAIFWHIPWPNPEAFGICPWQRQLVDGLLGADLIGFHIQSHCNNFLETVSTASSSLASTGSTFPCCARTIEPSSGLSHQCCPRR
jgi:trehalose-6-phosphate synthase